METEVMKRVKGRGLKMDDSNLHRIRSEEEEFLRKRDG